MYYCFENQLCRILIYNYHGCLLYFEEQNPTLILEDSISKVQFLAHRIGNRRAIQDKKFFLSKLDQKVQDDFCVLFQESSCYICYKTYNNSLFYLTFSKNSIHKVLISSDPDCLYQPMCLKLIGTLNVHYLFSIQNISPLEKSLIFLPLTKDCLPTELLNVTSSCLDYKIFTEDSIIYLVFPLKWEYYVINVYSFDCKECFWDFKYTLVYSQCPIEHFDVLYHNGYICIAYTTNVFGTRLLYFLKVILYKENALIHGEMDAPQNQSIDRNVQFLYKTGCEITPNLSIENEMIKINWIENNQIKSLLK